MNPLKKMLSFLGFQGLSPDLLRDFGREPGTCSGSRVPLEKRVAKRRRNNKRARKARRRNRS